MMGFLRFVCRFVVAVTLSGSFCAPTLAEPANSNNNSKNTNVKAAKAQTTAGYPDRRVTREGVVKTCGADRFHCPQVR